MNYRYSLLLPPMLVVLLFVGSASAVGCPAIPSPPYVPKSPQEDIVKVEAYLEHLNPAPAAPPSPSLAGVSADYAVHLTVTFAAPTPPADQAIYIIVTELQGTPPTETVVGCQVAGDPTSTTYQLTGYVSGVGASIAVYAWLGPAPGTDRAPNSGSYPITSLSAVAPDFFYDVEPAAVGGVVVPVNKLEILTPYLALAGLVIAVSAVVVAKRRKD